MIQPTRLVHHMLVKRRRDLVRLAIVHRPHRPNHRPEPEKLHRRCEVDHLVRTLFVSDSRMTRREIREFGVLHFAADHPLDRKASVVESECRLEWLFPVRNTVTRKVHPFALTQLFDDPGNGRLFSLYARECSQAVDEPTNAVQLRTYGMEVALAGGCGLTNRKETFPLGCRTGEIALSSANEGGECRGIRRDV